MIKLNEGEQQIMPYIIKGITTKEIASKINMSLSCVKWRKHMMFMKFQVHSSESLITKYNEMMKKQTELPNGL